MTIFGTTKLTKEQAKELGRIVAQNLSNRIEELEAKLAKAVDALGNLVQHTHNCEEELTEELHGHDFCGESLPLTDARATLAEIQDG